MSISNSKIIIASILVFITFLWVFVQYTTKRVKKVTENITENIIVPPIVSTGNIIPPSPTGNTVISPQNVIKVVSFKPLKKDPVFEITFKQDGKYYSYIKENKNLLSNST